MACFASPEDNRRQKTIVCSTHCTSLFTIAPPPAVLKMNIADRAVRQAVNHAHRVHVARYVDDPDGTDYGQHLCGRRRNHPPFQVEFKSLPGRVQRHVPIGDILDHAAMPVGEMRFLDDDILGGPVDAQGRARPTTIAYRSNRATARMACRTIRSGARVGGCQTACNQERRQRGRQRTSHAIALSSARAGGSCAPPCRWDRWKPGRRATASASFPAESCR